MPQSGEEPESCCLGGPASTFLMEEQSKCRTMLDFCKSKSQLVLCRAVPIFCIAAWQFFGHGNFNKQIIPEFQENSQKFTFLYSDL